MKQKFDDLVKKIPLADKIWSSKKTNNVLMIEIDNEKLIQIYDKSTAVEKHMLAFLFAIWTGGKTDVYPVFNLIAAINEVDKDNKKIIEDYIKTPFIP